MEGSLRRLGTDYIDLYQIHYRDGKTPIGEVIETLEEMKKRDIYDIMVFQTFMKMI